VPDSAVGVALDAELCRLLQKCFPHERKFKDRRHYNEPPRMRWIIRVDGRLVAHIAAHEKVLSCGSRRVPFCGISEVCIVPDFRGRGFLPKLLAALEDYYSGLSYDFSLLLGPAEIYKRYGYQSVGNVYFPDQSDDCAEFAMYKALRPVSWPEDTVSIGGAYF
jgi:predicted acetyltransferase